MRTIKLKIKTAKFLRREIQILKQKLRVARIKLFDREEKDLKANQKKCKHNSLYHVEIQEFTGIGFINRRVCQNCRKGL